MTDTTAQAIDKARNELINAIKKGYTAVNEMTPKADENPLDHDLAYTIGGFVRGLPELVCTMPPEGHAAYGLSHIMGLLISRQLTSDQIPHELELVFPSGDDKPDARMLLRTIVMPEEQMREAFKLAFAMGVEEFGDDYNWEPRFLHMLVADDSGKYPGEEGFEQGQMTPQPPMGEIVPDCYRQVVTMVADPETPAFCVERVDEI